MNRVGDVRPDDMIGGIERLSRAIQFDHFELFLTDVPRVPAQKYAINRPAATSDAPNVSNWSRIVERNSRYLMSVAPSNRSRVGCNQSKVFYVVDPDRFASENFTMSDS